jgi:predicted dehydrogenase
MRENLHYDWHWDFLTGNGDLGNQGIHQMDIARWILGEQTLSPEVFSIGGRFGYVDDGNTPNTQIVYHNYSRAPLIFEVRGLGRWIDNDARPTYLGASIGVITECEDGYMVMPTYDSGTAYDNSGKVIKKFKGGGDHFANFIEAVRSRKPSDLNADILEGHLSSALCHTGNISYLTGRNQAPGQVLDQVESNPVAVESIGRMFEHLQVNDIDLNSTQITMGSYLHMDPATERFTNSNEANQLLKREYRKPFVISDDV